MNTTIFKQRGIGLVEILVSMAIGLFILAGVVQLYATSTVNAKTVSGAAAIQENARFAFSRLEQDIKQAGYAGCFSLKSAYPRQYFSEAADDYMDVVPRYDQLVTTNAAAGEENDFSMFVSGENDVDVGSLAFDSLTVRYLSAKSRRAVTAITGGNQIYASGLTDFKSGEVAAIGDCSRVSFFEIGNTNSPEVDGYVEIASGSLGRQYTMASDSSGTGTALESAVAYVYGGDTGAITYSIGTSAAGNALGESCSSSSPQYCALRRNNDELVEGISAFDVEYGWQDVDGKLYFHTADAMNAARWFFVDRVRISATFNSIESAPTNDGSPLLTKTYARTFLMQNQLPVDYSRLAAGL